MMQTPTYIYISLTRVSAYKKWFIGARRLVNSVPLLIPTTLVPKLVNKSNFFIDMEVRILIDKVEL